MNRDGTRKLPPDAPTAFIPDNWRAYVTDDNEQLDRHYYELCALWQLRVALRAGGVWLKQSRRYADPESYLIPKTRWPELRAEVCTLTGTPANGAARLEQRHRELDELLERL